MVKHAAMVILFVLKVGVRVGIEVNECQLSMGAGMTTQQWQSHKVVTAKADKCFTCRSNRSGALLHLGQHIFAVAIHEFQVAVVDGAQAVSEHEIPGETTLFPAQIGAGPANCSGTVASTGAAAGAQVVGDTHHDSIDIITIEVAGQGETEVAEHIEENGSVVKRRRFVSHYRLS